MRKVTFLPAVLLAILFLLSQPVEAASDRPRLQIREYQVTPKIAVAGKPFQLKFTIENVGQKDAHNIDVTLANIEGQPTLQFFSPLGKGNYFFIDELKEDKEIEETMEMTTNGKIESGSYNLVLKFDYEDSSGHDYTGTEIVGITVLRKPIIKIEGLKYPTSLKSLETTEGGKNIPKLTANIVNASDFGVNAVSVSLSGNLKVEDDNYYIGNLEGGGFDTFETKILDFKPGRYKEKLVVTYRNDFGEEKKIVKKFTVKVKGEELRQGKPQGLWASIVNFFRALFGIGK